LGLEQLEDRVVPSTLIPIANRRDLVFDPIRGLLDITTSNGRVQQFSVGAQQLVGGFGLGYPSSFNGADISLDGNFLYVTDQTTSGSQGFVRRFDLNTGQVANLTYTRVSGEGGSWDVAIAANGKGLVDTMSAGAPMLPLRQLNLNTNTLTIRTDDPGAGGGGRIPANSLIHRSADRSLFLVTESTLSSGPVFTYNAVTDTFTPGPNLGVPLTNALSAVNRNGTLLAFELNGQVVVTDAQFHLRANLPGLDGGVVFDPTKDVLYAVSSSTGQVVAYDTNTWAVKFQMAIGEATTPGQAFGNGVMAVSNDGNWLFLSTPSGVREFALPSSAPAVNFSFGGFAVPPTAGAVNTFTITARDANGNPASGYTGTVHFTSSDPQAVLPADYTFTYADAGSHTFTATLKTAGNQFISVADVNNTSILGGVNLPVSPGALATIRVDATGPQPVGYAFWPMFSARDAYNNVITNYTGTIHISSSDPQAVLPADYTFTANDRGLHSFPVTFLTAGNQTLTATDTQNSAVSGSATVLVGNYIPGLHFTIAPSQSVVTAGSPFSLTVTVYDQYNQVARYYVGTVTFLSSDHGAGVVLPPDYAFTAADAGVHVFTGVTLVTAANPSSVLIHDAAYITGQTATSTAVTVIPAAASTFNVTGFPSATTAGSTGTFTVTARDPYGNVATGYTGTVVFDSSDGQAVLPGAYTFTATDNGTHTFSASLRTAGVQSLTVTDTATTTLMGSQGGIAVSAAAATHFVLSAPATAQAGTAFSLTVTAVDAYGNVATGYAGTVHFQSTDSAASLSADYTFVSGDNGVHTFLVTLWTPGLETILVADLVNSSITGSDQVSL
jgi:hypothetical protein